MIYQKECVDILYPPFIGGLFEVVIVRRMLMMIMPLGNSFTKLGSPIGQRNSETGELSD